MENTTTEIDSKIAPSYWQDVHQKTLPEELVNNEFESSSAYDPFETHKSRRSFLKIMGVSLAAAPVAGCFRIPVKKALPYVHKDEVIVPGVANWYATVSEDASIIVKTREGRPIKIEGNSLCSITRGGASALCHGSLLSLYDASRYTTPFWEKSWSWKDIDQSLRSTLGEIKKTSKKIYLITPVLKSPSAQRLLKILKQENPNLVHVVSDTRRDFLPMALLYKKLFPSGHILPRFDFSQADLVVGVEADFLGTWYSPVEMTKAYSSRRQVERGKTSSFLPHVQIESLMSVTGSNADERHPLAAEQVLGFLEYLYVLICQQKNIPCFLNQQDILGLYNDETREAAVRVAQLLQKSSRPLFLVGHPSVYGQYLSYLISHSLSMIGETVKLESSLWPVAQFDCLIEELPERLKTEEAAAVIFSEVNPVYDFHQPDFIKELIQKTPYSLALTTAPNETSSLCNVILPANHFLESWGDRFFTATHCSFRQPVISPLYGSRQSFESLLAILGTDSLSTLTYHDFVQETWKELLVYQTRYQTFEELWNNSLHDGVVFLDQHLPRPTASMGPIVSKDFFQEQRKEWVSFLETKKSHFSFASYRKISMGDGFYASSPWLQELPDPVTKATWDNYLLCSPQDANALGFVTSDEVSITLEIAGRVVTHKVPVLVQPGMPKGSFSMALGYGREVVGKAGKNVGINISSWYNTAWNLAWITSLSKTGKSYPLALTQTHHSFEGRDIVREKLLPEYEDLLAKGEKLGPKHHLITLWDEELHKNKEHAWAMAIDLTKCTGCSACVVSCSAENNVPVVGRQEVLNRREMHWIRIDRYYHGDESNPKVVYQPLNCQHCENAPCETVCPVLATVHSSDGLNTQIYNRCVGTRYCANNCPYKVRRFNWFDYPHEDKHENMVLNPDVTVRSRGVMEKCSMCIQRIQEGKLTAKKENRSLRDGEVKVACQQSCPADAIVFGDLLNTDSAISRLVKDERNYTVLEEINVRPRVSYLTKIRASLN